MKRAVLTAALLCLVGLSGPSADIRSSPIAIDANGNLLYTHTTPPPGLVDPFVVIGEDGILAVTNITPPPGLVDPFVVIGEDGILAVTNITPPPGLVDPAVVIGQDGTITVTHVTPPPGLSDPRVLISEAGTYLFEKHDGPALSVTGLVIMIVLMIILGGYTLSRWRTAQLP